MPAKTTRRPKSPPREDLSLRALIVVLVLTNVWFVFEVAPYVH
jgi:hypothetical protein